MNDLSNYCSQAQEIKDLKAELRKSKAEVEKLTERLNKKDAKTERLINKLGEKLNKKKGDTSKQKQLMQARSINIAHAIGRGHYIKQIVKDMRVCTATVTAVNKQIN